MTSFAVADKFARVGSELIRAQMKAVNEAADVLRDLAEANARAATGGDLRLGGVWKNKQPNPNAKVAVRVSRAKSTDHPIAKVEGKPGGMFAWLEFGTDQHFVGAGRAGRKGGLTLASSIRSGTMRRMTASGRLGKAADRTVMPTKVGYRTGPWIAGGSPAYKPFTRALNIVGPKIPEIVQRETRRTITRAGFK